MSDKDQPGDAPSPQDTTAVLLDRARGGDSRALNALLDRYRAPLRRWASGRLPGYARDVLDTDDLVQEALIQSARHLAGFDRRWKGAFHSYLRQAVLNRIRDQVRRSKVREEAVERAGNLPAHETSPLERVIGAEALERYERAFETLTAEERELIAARMEMNLTYEELGQLMGRPSADAVRMAVKRALLKLARQMETRTGHE